MSEQPDFRIAWRAVEKAMARARPSPELDVRVAVSSARVFPRGGIAIAMAVPAAAALLAFWMNSDPAPIGERMDTALFTPATCAPAIARADLTLAVGCRVALESPALAIEAHTNVLLRRTTRGVRILEGTAAFAVEKVHRGAEVVVLVSGGQIEVVGTRFVIRETGVSGTVTLEEGRIAFVTLNGVRRDLAPGAVYQWTPQAHVAREAPALAAEAPPVIAPAVTPPLDPARASKPSAPALRSARPAIDPVEPVDPLDQTPPITKEAEDEALPPPRWSAARTARVVERVSELRAEGRYAEAARWIAKLLDAPLDRRAAEVLSFERGEILDHKLLLREEACVHWRAHAERFPEGRYRAEVTKSLAACDQETLRPRESE